MELEYRKASADDLELLVETRLEVLRAANGLAADADMGEVEEQSREYYREALRDGTHTAYLVFDGGRFAGAGGVSYYRVMPTYHNPGGRKAYIMNMYTRPEYRRKGIAYRTLDLLVADAREKGITFISLEATAQGRPLYAKYGFIPMNDEMILRIPELRWLTVNVNGGIASVELRERTPPPESDAEGVLQDMHWFSGYICYFQSYVLGNCYDGHFLYAMEKEIPDLFDQVRQGDFSKILNWNISHIHRFASTKTPQQVLWDATGEKLSAGRYLTYLTEKYKRIYNI